MDTKKKHVTIRMLSCLLAVTLVIGSAVPTAAASKGGGRDYGTQSSAISNIHSGSGNVSKAPDTFSYAVKCAALKVSLVVTSTDGVSKYNPALNTDQKDVVQPLYRDITPLGLSCNTKAFSGLTGNSTIGWYGVGGCYIYKPEASNYIGAHGAAGGGRDIEGAVERTSDGKWQWNWDNNNVSKYEITKDQLNASYKAATKKKDTSGNKVQINPANKDGVTASNLYDRFMYNPDNGNSIWLTQGKDFLKLGMVTIEGDEAEKPANKVKIAGNRAIIYTLLHSMKTVHSKDKDSELNSLFDRAMKATLGEDSDFKFIILLELAESLYRDGSKDLYWLTTNNYAAASLCNSGSDFKNFPSINKGGSVKTTAGSSSGNSNFGGAATGNKNNSDKSIKRNMGLRDYLKKMEGMTTPGGQAQKNRTSRGICGSYRYWFGQDYGSNVQHLTGLVDTGYAQTGGDAKKKKPEVLASRLCYQGPIYNPGGANATAKRSMGFITGKWADDYDSISDNDNETYQWGWGCMSIEDADGGQIPTMQKAVMSSTNISLVSTAGEEKLDSPNFNFATLVADGEHTKAYDKLEYEAKATLQKLEADGELTPEVRELLQGKTEWKSSKRKTTDDEIAEILERYESLSKKEKQQMQDSLATMLSGFSRNGGSFIKSSDSTQK